jgi:adenylate cyclase class 2
MTAAASTDLLGLDLLGCNSLRRNIEVKARLCDLAGARAGAERITGSSGREEIQTDTYFRCDNGRLKLREITGQGAQLVWYERADSSAAKPSDYRLTPLGNDPATAAALRESLAAALGVRGVVRKIRRIYLYENVRIHLDEVAGLGHFLEFEAVLDTTGPDLEADERRSHERLIELTASFGLAPDDFLAGSYGELCFKTHQPEA